MNSEQRTATSEQRAATSTAASPPEAITAVSIAATLAAALAAYIAYGIDFSESSRRFARLMCGWP